MEKYLNINIKNSDLAWLDEEDENLDEEYNEDEAEEEYFTEEELEEDYFEEE